MKNFCANNGNKEAINYGTVWIRYDGFSKLDYKTIFTAYILQKQIKQNEEFNRQTYEMQRRVNAANTLFQWSINSKVEETIAKRVVEKFSKDQVRKLLNEESFKIKRNIMKKFHLY